MFTEMAIATVCWCSMGTGEIKVEVQNRDGGYTSFPADAGAPIAVPISSNVERVNVHAAPGVAPPFPDIGRITIVGSTTQQFEVIVSAGVLDVSLSRQYAIAGDNWDGIGAQDSSVAGLIRLAGHIEGDLTGSISVGEIYRLDIDGGVQANVTMTNTTDPSTLFALYCGSIGASSHISRLGRDIRLISVFGNCAGDIEAPSGNLRQVDIGGDCTGTIQAASPGAGTISELTVGGRLGTASQPARVGFRNSLANLTAGEINAEIRGPNTRFWGGDIQHLVTTGANGTSGRLAGSVTVERLSRFGVAPGEITLAGPFEARVEVLEGLTAGDFSINVPATDFPGLLVLNASNDGWAWTGPVNVGSATLGPDYSETSASIGGGAAGVVPFTLHGTDCEPATDGGSVAFDSAPDLSTPIQVRHYGTIAIEGNDPNNSIEFEAAAPGYGFISLADCIDSVSVDPNDETVLLVVPSKKLLNGYTYRITPKRSAPDFIRCELAVMTGVEPVTEEPPVADYTYEFCVGTALPSDINGDDSVDVFDFAMLAENFSMLGCLLPGDLNADGSVDVFDFAIFAGDFSLTGFGSCSTGAAAARMGAPAGGMESLVKSLGYESVAEYCDWLKALPKKDQITEIAALLELAQEQK